MLTPTQRTEILINSSARLLAPYLRGHGVRRPFCVRATYAHVMHQLRPQSDTDLAARLLFIHLQRGYKYERLAIEKLQRERLLAAPGNVSPLPDLERIHAAADRDLAQGNAPQKLVYAISRWSNSNRAAARHIDNGEGLPLCGGNGRKAFSWERDEGEPTCAKCEQLIAQRARAHLPQPVAVEVVTA